MWSGRGIMGEAGSSERSEYTRRHIPEDNNIHGHRHNFQSHTASTRLLLYCSVIELEACEAT